MNTLAQALAFDREHLWHPYTSMRNPLQSYMVERCEGVYIYLKSGEQLIDGMSSWWSAIHGYNHPRLNEAIENQLRSMSHVMFGGLTHYPAVELGRRILQLVPTSLQHIFYADSGSIAVEVAMKMALQYQYSRGLKAKTKFLTPSGGYHGDTWHAMSVCDPVGGMHTIWNGRLGEQIFVSRPYCAFYDEWDPSDLDEFRETIVREHDQIAAVILEPIVQGAGGMRFYNPAYLKGVRELCDEWDVLLIADEIATGFGRSGRMFACEWAAISPDIMCIGKALTGGYMTMAATLCTTKVATGIEGSFMHGPTFMGNPLACAVAVASLDLIIENSPLERIAQIESIMRAEFSTIHSSKVANIRVLGAIGVIEMCQSVDMATIQRSFVEHGVWVRPFGRLVYIMPQYIITDEQLRTLCRALIEVVS
ncbi:MAG: adenosylmethionine--8-amino-7-oxononanoate transaminase [Mucinivorans sp.]